MRNTPIDNVTNKDNQRVIIYIQRSVKNRNIKTQDPAAKITDPSITIYTYDIIRKTPKETQRDTNT